MLIEYINEALRRANYEIIDDENPYYGEVKELKEFGLPARRLKNVGII